MKITEIRLGTISVPLRTPFKTALRTVNSANDVVIEIHTDGGLVGRGAAQPTGVITGDTTGAILGAFTDHIIKALVGRDVEDFENNMHVLESCIQHSNSAKAAADMALWDLYGQMYKMPIYKLLGGSRNSIVTDITISVNEPDEMARDAVDAVKRGYDCLKVKVGSKPELDVARLRAIRDAVGKEVAIRIDANQAWSHKQAVRILNQMQNSGLELEFVEQPVKGWDLKGLQYVTEHSYVPVMADESLFSPRDAMRILQTRAADMLSIKLMKCGGITQALRIVATAEIYGVECMLSSMLEAKVSATAAVHLACAKQIITKIDLDGPVLCREDPVHGGAIFHEKDITLPDTPGLGITGIDGVTYV